MPQTETYLIPPLDAPTRLSDLRDTVFDLLPSRKALKKALDKGWVLCNDKPAKTNTIVQGGETLSVTIPDKKRPTVALDLDVLFEDNFLAVINKPSGIEVSGNKKITIENALAHNLQTSSESDAIQAEAIHRLDYPTSGVLLIGKTRSAVMKLNKLFSNRETEKTYLAVTIGEMPSSGVIDAQVDGKASMTSFKILSSVSSERFGFLNLVEVNIETGRRHQIRKHFHRQGNPILGDKEYFKEGLILNGKGLYLHAQKLSFVHPFTNELLRIEAPIPKKFHKLFE